MVEIKTITVNIKEGSGYVDVYRNGAYVGRTGTNISGINYTTNQFSSPFGFDFYAGHSFKFVAIPLEGYSFVKMCSTDCVTANEISGTINDSGTLDVYFRCERQIQVTALRLQDYNRNDRSLAEYVVDYTENGIRETVLSGSHIPVNATIEEKLRLIAQVRGWCNVSYSGAQPQQPITGGTGDVTGGTGSIGGVTTGGTGSTGGAGIGTVAVLLAAGVLGAVLIKRKR